MLELQRQLKEEQARSSTAEKRLEKRLEAEQARSSTAEKRLEAEQAKSEHVTHRLDEERKHSQALEDFVRTKLGVKVSSLGEGEQWGFGGVTTFGSFAMVQNRFEEKE